MTLENREKKAEWYIKNKPGGWEKHNYVIEYSKNNPEEKEDSSEDKPKGKPKKADKEA